LDKIVPLSFNERFLRFQREYMFIGGMPEAVKNINYSNISRDDKAADIRSASVQRFYILIVPEFPSEQDLVKMCIN